jgi:acetolactate synthase small subunit
MSDRDQGPVQNVYRLEGTRRRHRAGQEAVGGSGQCDRLFVKLALQLISVTPAKPTQVPVWAVLDYTKTSTISRELLLAKVSVLGPEYAEQQMSGGPTHSAHATEAVHDYLPTNESNQAQEPTKYQAEQALAQTFESGGLPQSLSTYNGRGQQQQRQQFQGHALSQSEALIAKNLHLNAIKTLTDQFGGRLVDVAENSVIVELTAKSSRVEAFLSLLRPFGILEAARSGESSSPSPSQSSRTFPTADSAFSTVCHLLVLRRRFDGHAPYPDPS